MTRSEIGLQDQQLEGCLDAMEEIPAEYLCPCEIIMVSNYRSSSLGGKSFRRTGDVGNIAKGNQADSKWWVSNGNDPMNPRRSSILKGFDHIGFESCFLTPKSSYAKTK